MEEEVIPKCSRRIRYRVSNKSTVVTQRSPLLIVCANRSYSS